MYYTSQWGTENLVYFRNGLCGFPMYNFWLCTMKDGPINFVVVLCHMTMAKLWAAFMHSNQTDLDLWAYVPNAQLLTTTLYTIDFPPHQILP